MKIAVTQHTASTAPTQTIPEQTAGFVALQTEPPSTPSQTTGVVALQTAPDSVLQNDAPYRRAEQSAGDLSPLAS